MLEEFTIQGKTKLKGTVKISGAKNSALKILPACLLTDEGVCLSNIPQVSDIFCMIDLLHSLGSTVQFQQDTIKIVTLSIKSCLAHYDIVRKMRASIGVLGPLMARHHEAVVSLPGGCAIGGRPVDIHLSGLSQMGADISLEGGYIHAKGNLTGAVIHFPFPSMGATENIMMAATLAKGTTVIHNAAREPEIVDLANFLRKMGAQIDGDGTSIIEIQGVTSLKGCEYRVIPDRLETATYAFAALITEGQLLLTDTDRKYLEPVEMYFKGVKIQEIPEGILVSGAVHEVANITTAPFPGYATDLQAQAMALLTQAPGMSVIHEALFENRFMHVPELARMGAHIEVKGHTAYIHGKTDLFGAPVMATDLRGGVAMVIAALAAQGETIIKRVYHLDRGYAALVDQLNGCGAMIQRTPQRDVKVEHIALSI